MAEVTVNIIKTLFTGESRPLEESAKKAEASLGGFAKATKKHANFLGKIGKILEYRFIRGGISQIVKGLEEGKKAIEAYDKSLNGLSASRAATFMKEMAENATLLKNTFASLFMTIYAAAKPAIDFLVEALQTAMNALNQFISALLGRSTYTKAVKGINEVTSSVKALKKQIFGFDELNILNAPTGANQEDYSKNFEETEIAKPFMAMADAVAKIKERLPFDDMLKTVKLIGTGILAWKVGSSIVEFMAFLKNPDLQLAVGVSLVIVGIVGLLDALEDAVTEGLTEDSFYNLIASTGAVIVGGTMVGNALGNTMMGATFGVIAGSGTALYTVITDAVNTGLSPLETFLIPILSTIVGAAIGSLVPVVGTGVGALIGAALGAIALGEVRLKNERDGLSTELDHWFSDLKIKIATFYFDIYDKLPKWLQNILDGFGVFRKDLVEKELNPIAQKIKEVMDKLKEFRKEQQNNPLSGSVASEARSIKKKQSLVVEEIIEGIDFYANGGFPSTGDLFVANEQGAELVTSFGNRTGVYNQDQFGATMAAANQEVVQAVLAIGSQITGAVNNKPVPSVKIGDRDIFNASQRGSTLVGSSLIQGGRP